MLAVSVADVRATPSKVGLRDPTDVARDQHPLRRDGTAKHNYTPQNNGFSYRFAF